MPKITYGVKKKRDEEQCIDDPTYCVRVSLAHAWSVQSGQSVASIIAARGDPDKLRRFDQVVEIDKTIRQRMTMDDQADTSQQSSKRHKCWLSAAQPS